jgi:hypothetical protein
MENKLLSCIITRELIKVFAGVEMFILNPQQTPKNEITTICKNIGIESLASAALHQLPGLIVELSQLSLFRYSFHNKGNAWNPLTHSFSEFSENGTTSAVAEHEHYQYDQREIKRWIHQICTSYEVIDGGDNVFH